jgi:hypothetical protein
MKMLLFIGFVVISFSVVHGQKKDRRNGIYLAHLSSVEVSHNLNPGTVDTLLSVYEDSVIKIDWDYSKTQIDFELYNKTDETLKVLWDDVAFVSLSNETGKIFHKGIKYIDRENSQPATSIYKKLRCPI